MSDAAAGIRFAVQCTLLVKAPDKDKAKEAVRTFVRQAEFEHCDTRVRGLLTVDKVEREP
jgi:hypothetical protein